MLRPLQGSEAGWTDVPPAKRRRGAHPAERATPASEGQQAAAADGRASASTSGVLGALPAELLFRVLSFLSAEDLTAAAPTCRLFQHATGSGTLWRRLFLARWGAGRHACLASRGMHAPWH